MIPCSLQDVLFQPCTCCVNHRAEDVRREQMEVEAAQCPAHAQPRALLCPLCLNNVLAAARQTARDRKSTRLNSSHIQKSRMPSSA